MNFEVGGRRFYAMVSPEGQEALVRSESILPLVQKLISNMLNAFADKDENPDLPGSEWDLNFSEQNGKTTVSISIYNESLARLEKMQIEMGFPGRIYYDHEKPGRITGNLIAKMIFVFKTSVKTTMQIKKLKPHIDKILPTAKWNFDLEDCDKILRVDSEEISF